MPPIKSFDIETTGDEKAHALDRRKGRIFAYSTCTPDEKIYVGRFDKDAVSSAVALARFDRMWSDTTLVKTIHNKKFDQGFLERRYNKEQIRKHNIHCTYTMSKVLKNNHYSHALDDLSWDYGGVSKDDDRAITPYLQGGRTYDMVPEQLMRKYQERDAFRGMLLYLFFMEKLKENKDWLECYEWERRVIPVTIDIEDRGMMLDEARAKKMIAWCEEEAVKAHAQINKIVGDNINPESENMRDYIFGKLKMQVLAKTKTGKPKLDKDIVILLRQQNDHPILEALQRFKAYNKGASDVHGYLRRAVNGVIHANIKPYEAVTGRQACENPNMMNVRKEKGIKTQIAIPMRRIFRPRPGFVLFFLDYAGQEMRILVDASRDPLLVDIANKRGPKEFNNNLHYPACFIFYGKDRFLGWKSRADSVKHDKHHPHFLFFKGAYDAAKNSNFAKAYGAQWFQIMKTLSQIDYKEAPRIVREYERVMPKLCALMPEMIRQVRTFGYIQTRFGDRIHVPRGEAFEGTNYYGQGTGARMLKRAEVNIHEYLQEETGGEAHILMPIHDELVIEYPRSQLKYAPEIIGHCMHLMAKFPGHERFSLPFEVEAQISTTDWTQKADFHVDPEFLK